MARPHDRRCPHLGSPRFERSPVLSSSYRNRLARPEEEPPPPPPPPHDFEVTGTLTPDCTGYYDEAGTHNGKPYYERTDGAWFIWYKYIPLFNQHYWQITSELGAYPAEFWSTWTATYTEPPGQYTPQAGGTGTATVAEA